ncbi:MAG TPA: hypothetical protein VLH09_02450, partial [Bryobacteraceae bacterium]|nr:hypothetical protein [Bryobacteraceae bacterium]
MGSGLPLPKPAAGPAPAPEPAAASAYARHSHGLEQFFSQIQGQGSLCILDIGGVTQANVAFITSLGHKLYSEDFLRVLDSAATPDPAAGLLQPTLAFPPETFDGVLLWD